MAFDKKINNNSINQKEKIEEIILEIEEGYKLNFLLLKGFYEKYKEEYKNRHFSSYSIGLSEKTATCNDIYIVEDNKRQCKINLACNIVNNAIDKITLIEEKRKLEDFKINEILKNSYDYIIFDEAKNWKAIRDLNKKGKYLKTN